MIWDAVMRLLKMKESNHKPKKKRKRPKKIKLQSNSVIYWCRSLLSIVNVTHRKSKIEKKKKGVALLIWRALVVQKFLFLFCLILTG